MPRKKYHEDGKNEYSPPKEKPPRYDLRKLHDKVVEVDDKKQEKADMKLSEDKDVELAKKIAKKRLKYGLFQIQKDYVEMLKQNPDDLQDYLIKKYPRPEQFTSWLLDEINDFNRKIVLTDVKPFIKQLETMSGSSYIKRHIKNEATLRTLDIH